MSKKLWGGRFSKKTDPLVEEFTKSIQYDNVLYYYDLLGSMYHVLILEKNHYLTHPESQKLYKALETIAKEVDKGKIPLKDEDIHTYIQNLLEKKVGTLAQKLHTARSRNAQVVFATKLYCNIKLEGLKGIVDKVISSIKNVIQQNKKLIIPGFTHLQHAQPVYLKDYLGAYIEMLIRDKGRIVSIFENTKITIGAGALAGTPILAREYNREVKKVIREQGLDVIFNIHPTVNSLDDVSDRDFVIEILSALSIVGMHLSRLAEDLIIWSTKEFDFVEIDESFCTGSSLMPQKKNPDVLELIRGYAGRLYGNLISVLVVMKGLPLTYNRDMQLDKEPLFDSFEIVSKELKVLQGLIETLKFNKEKIEEAVKDESLYATDLVYYLVDKKVPFKQAHTVIGKLVKYSIDNKRAIKDMSDAELKKFSDKFVRIEIARLFDPRVSVESKRSIKRTK